MSLMHGRLLAVSDLHVAYEENRDITAGLRPTAADDWLIVAGDVGERVSDIEWTLGLLAERFAKVVWVPGNHELWTHPDDPVKLRGEERYRHLVELCRGLGVVTPEDPYPVWRGEGGPVTVAPLFVLYDYSFRMPGVATKEESLRLAHEAGVVCTDEYFLHPDPHPSRDAWCRERVALTERRLADVDPAHPTVLVNHWPLVRQPTDILRYPEFAQWCGTTLTADWHRRFRAAAVVYGHLHIPRVTWYDGVKFSEVSLGYPREWKRRPPRDLLRPVLPPAPASAAAQAARPPAPAAAEPARLLQQLLPDAVTAAEAFSDPPEPPAERLYPEEAQAVARAVPHRQAEFATVRQCARRALGTLGVEPAPLLPGRRGAPQWPAGIVGSMTHCAGYRAAAVARRGDVLGVGIDAEPNEELKDGLLEAIALPEEQELVRARMRGTSGVCWDRLLFSAKESVFKVWYPLTGRELDFDEARIDVDPADGTFTARILVDAPTVDGTSLARMQGRWLCRSGLLVTAVSLTAGAGGRAGNGE
nr:Tmn23 [Streptomyces sp.]